MPSSPDSAVKTSKPSWRKPREIVRSVSSSSSMMSAQYGMLTRARVPLRLANIDPTLRNVSRNSEHLHYDFRLMRIFVQLLLPNWKCDGYRGPPFQDAVDTNLALVPAHVGGTDTESETGSLARLGGEKRLEDVRENVRRNAAAGIAYANFDAVFQRKLLCGDGHSAAILRRFGCIDQQIHQHLR